MRSPSRLTFFGRLAVRRIEKRGLTTPPNGPETPADAGLSFESFRIHSFGRELRAWFTPAPSGAAAALLLFHGNNDSISRWVGSIAILAGSGIATMVFDYSGFGESSGIASAANFAGDARSAYREFRARLAPGQRGFVFGISLGSAILLEAASDLVPAPDGVIVNSAFSSAREAAATTGLVSPLWTRFLPDLWNNVEAARRLQVPLLVTHSDADETFPVSMARRIFDAAPEPKKFVVQHGLPHDAPVSAPTIELWRPVIEFVIHSS